MISRTFRRGAKHPGERCECPGGGRRSAPSIRCFAAVIIPSTDNGVTWHIPCPAIKDTPINSLASINAGAGGTVLLASVNWKPRISRDSGVTWTAIQGLVPDTASSVYKFCVAANMIFAVVTGASDVIYKSGDFGLSWQPASTGLPSPSIMAITSSANGQAESTCSWGVWVEMDAFSNQSTPRRIGPGLIADSSAWTRAMCFRLRRIRMGLEELPFSPEQTKTCIAQGTTARIGLPQGVRPMSIIAIPNASGGSIVFAGTSGTIGGNAVYESVNYGESWTGLTSGLPHNSIMTLIVVGKHLYAGTEGRGVLRLRLNLP